MVFSAIGKLKGKAEGPRRKVVLIHLEFDGLAWVGWVITLYKILWNHHNSCQNSLTLHSSNRSIPQISGLTIKGYVSLLTWCVQHMSEGTTTTQGLRWTESPFSVFCGNEEKRVDNFIWGFYCFSQEMTIVTSAHVSLVRTNHIVPISCKEEKCNSLSTWKEEGPKFGQYQQCQSHLPWSSNDCITFVTTQEPTCLPVLYCPQ